MSDASPERLERLEMLLAEEALGQIDECQEAELNELLRLFPDVDRECFLRAAAAMDLALASEPTQPLPNSLRDTVLDQAKDYVRVSNNGKLRRLSDAAVSISAVVAENSTVRQASRSPDSPRSTTTVVHAGVNRDSPDVWRWAGWLVASAAILCFVILQLASSGSGERLAGSQSVDAEGNLQQQLQALLDQPTTRQYPWNSGATPIEPNVEGKVVWNQRRQQGFMTFDGLPINDASVEQYQLWIIDPKRDKHPIDGGVFDIRESGAVVVPITAKLEVIEPVAFAITIEKPGGVVVSDQSRLPLLATVN